MNLKFISAVSFANKRIYIFCLFLSLATACITDTMSITQIQAKAEMRNQMNQKQNLFFFCLIIVSWFYRTSCDMMQWEFLCMFACICHDNMTCIDCLALKNFKNNKINDLIYHFLLCREQNYHGSYWNASSTKKLQWDLGISYYCHSNSSFSLSWYRKWWLLEGSYKIQCKEKDHSKHRIVYSHSLPCPSLGLVCLEKEAAKKRFVVQSTNIYK